MYLHAKKLSKYSKRFKSYSEFHKLITGEGYLYRNLAFDNFFGKILSICIFMPKVIKIYIPSGQSREFSQYSG